MLKTITISIILLLFINRTYAQKHLDSVLFNIEQQLFQCTNDTTKTELVLKKMTVYFNAGILDSLVLNETNRVKWTLIKDSSVRANFLWNTALVNLLNKRYHAASSYLQTYQKFNPSDTSLHCQFMQALIYMRTSNISLNHLMQTLIAKDSLFNDLRCYKHLNDYELKGRNAYLVASAIIPGSGMMALKKPRQGITALALNTAGAYAIYSLAKSNLYFNAVTWGFLLVQKFYAGNIKLTDKFFTEKEAANRYKLSSECEENVKKLLIKYPLNIKK